MYRAQVGTWVSTGPHIDGSGSFLVYGKLITGMDGKIYMMDRMYASLYSWNTTTGVWTKLAGNNNIRGECDDGTVGTSCGMDIIDAFITRSGVVYIRELNRIRRLDSTNSMRTVLGRPAKSFFGHSAMATKLGSPNTFTTWKNGSRWEYSWIDGRNYYLLNLKPIGNTTHLAGNGMSEVITGGGDARTKGFLVFPGGTTYKTMMAQNTTNGDIYYNYRSDQIGRLTQAGMSWSTVVGGGGTAIQGASDGLVGLSVAYSSAYLLVPIGFHGSNLLVSYTYLNGSYRTMMKLYNGADSFRQSHFAGVDINNTTNQCSNGTAIGSCIVGWAYSNGGATYNTYDNTWFTTTSHASGGNTAVQIFPPAGTKNTVNLTRYPMGAARKHDASNNFVYYCEFVTGKIYKRNVGAATEAEIVPALNGTVSCVSNNLYYNSERNTLAVAVEYLGGYGLIEIPNP